MEWWSIGEMDKTEVSQHSSTPIIFSKEFSPMENPFRPRGLPALIGSLPLTDHIEACQLVLEHTPQIPLWIQLPAHREEGMVPQFMPGLPGICSTGDRVYLDTDQDDFDKDLLKFYEEYMAVVEGHTDLSESRFVLREDTARGFFIFVERLRRLATPPVAVKGQITGPFTFCTGISDQNKKAIIYDEQVKDAAVKLLALKSRWQVQQLSCFGCPVIIYFDEPALSGFGSSEFISISQEGIVQPPISSALTPIPILIGLFCIQIRSKHFWMRAKLLPGGWCRPCKQMNWKRQPPGLFSISGNKKRHRLKNWVLIQIN
jgi:hypothetical protein